MRLLIQHQSRYRYPRPATLGPHLVRLRPANHAKAKIEAFGLRIEQPCNLRWQQDPSGNHVARVSFDEGARVDRFDVLVELAVDIRPVNPFDFYLDGVAEKLPFAYPAETARDLLPFLDTTDPSFAGGPELARFDADLPREGDTISLLVALNQAVNRRIRYVIREETGIWTPEETLVNGRGSCRDSAVLLVALLRARGLAARFVSGYLVQLTDEGMIPDAPRGVGRDVVDLHAWAEVYLPGAGWIGLDATSGLLCGEGHIPLACTAHPRLAAPIEGSSDTFAEDVSFSMTVGRLGHEPRPTAPYTDEVWRDLVAAGERADARLAELGIVLTMGGEPTFNARENTELPEWNGEALGPDKWARGVVLARELARRLAPGAVILRGQGKHYPGESLPRWALTICGRTDGVPLWSEIADTVGSAGPSVSDARRFVTALADQLGVSGHVIEAFEDPWRFLQDEANLPVDVDPLAARLDDPEDRRRLARVLGRGLGREVGFVLPLAREGSAWRSERWSFRRGHLFLLPGDSPLGLRLPLRSLGPGVPLEIVEEPVHPPDPRRFPESDDTDQHALPAARAAVPAPASHPIRTAVCVEVRDGMVHVFLPPLPSAADFFAIVGAVDAVRRALALDVQLEGYPPPSSPELRRFAVTPDPGVLEVNVPPTKSTAEYVALLDAVFDAALHAGLHAEKYLVDGRQAGSGGGNHLTLGGVTPLASPFLSRPDLLAGFLTFFQHHPSLSYMFTGLFVGPTSQAPRLDEARHDALYEMEIALRRAFDGAGDDPPPWLADMLFRHLLVDVSGNTHRSEICIDKLFAPDGAHGRQGLVELRAFEMPPHVRMSVAQMILVRSIVAALLKEPYDRPLARYGQSLHDRYLLPFWMWRDFEDVLAFLADRGQALPPEGYRPFLEMRCPVVGHLAAGDVRLEVRNAIEPWHVLGEEMTATGTSRYVDSSVERIEVLADGLLAERHRVLVNGQQLPLVPTGKAGQYVGGVRFRAWAPPHSLHPHLGVHHPVRIDVLDAWGRRSLGACAYHVWHPEGRAFDAPPLTRFEAAARRAQRFTVEPAMPWPVRPIEASAHADAPYTLDLRRYPVDRPLPRPKKASEEA
ncbi:MAG: transglutaminase family protein [Minicystis sp.]